MARAIGPDDQYRSFYYTSGPKAGKELVPPGTPVPLYADIQASIPADVLGLDNSTIAGTPPTVLVGDTYQAPQFKYPDNIRVVYTRVLGGPVIPLYALADDRLDALEAAVTALQPGGSDAAATDADLTAEIQARAAGDTAAVGAAAALAIVFGG